MFLLSHKFSSTGDIVKNAQKLRNLIIYKGNIVESPDEDERGSQFLREATIPINDESFCNYDGFRRSFQICAGDTVTPKDTCQGDSGGPFVQRNEFGEWFLAGVTSSGSGCGGHGVYTRVSAYEDWIKRQMDRD